MAVACSLPKRKFHAPLGLFRSSWNQLRSMRAARTAKAKKGRQSLRQSLQLSSALGSNSAAAAVAAAAGTAAIGAELAAAVVSVVLRVAGD